MIKLLSRENPYFELFAAALGGAGIAIILDCLLARDHALAVFAYNFALTIFDYQETRPWGLGVVALGLAILGGLSIFYFRPLNAKGAFAGGFAAIAILGILIP